MAILGSKTYSAGLRGDRLERLGEAPNESLGEQPLRLEVRLVASPNGESTPDVDAARRERGARMVEALRRLREMSTFAEITDPVAWQRRQRKDRPLP